MTASRPQPSEYDRIEMRGKRNETQRLGSLTLFSCGNRSRKPRRSLRSVCRHPLLHRAFPLPCLAYVACVFPLPSLPILVLACSICCPAVIQIFFCDPLLCDQLARLASPFRFLYTPKPGRLFESRLCASNMP